jgi:hypothetical protein
VEECVRLPEDETSGSIHVEDIIKIKNVSFEKVHFVGLYCIIILQCTVPKKHKIPSAYNHILLTATFKIFN